MSEKYLKSYFKDNEKYKKQYGKFITNSYSLLKIDTSLEKSDVLTEKLQKFFDDFNENFISCYQVFINDIDFKSEYIDINKDLLNLDNDYDDKFSISIKELKKIKNLTKIDTIVIKKYEHKLYYDIVIELIKDMEIIGYLLPCKKFLT